MTATLFLRIASVLSLMNCMLHTVGGVFGSPQHGAEEIAVIETMKSHRFDVMGSMRSYWDFLFGYGLFGTIGLLVQAILFWQLASFAKTNPAWTRPIVALFFSTVSALRLCLGSISSSGRPCRSCSSPHAWERHSSLPRVRGPLRNEYPVRAGQ